MLEFMGKERACVLAVQLLDGTPHTATVHFAHAADPLRLIFTTSPKYRKSEALLKGGPVPASVTVGVSEDDMRTFQLDGTVQITEDKDIIETYFQKFPEKREHFTEDFFFVFTPTWWRYTDWTKPEGKTVMTSDGKVVLMKGSDVVEIKES